MRLTVTTRCKYCGNEYKIDYDGKDIETKIVVTFKCRHCGRTTK